MLILITKFHLSLSSINIFIIIYKKKAKNKIKNVTIERLFTFRWMFKATVDNSTKNFWLEKEISKSTAVDRDVRALDFLLSWNISASVDYLLSLFFVFIIQKIIVICHCILITLLGLLKLRQNLQEYKFTRI